MKTTNSSKNVNPEYSDIEKSVTPCCDPKDNSEKCCSSNSENEKKSNDSANFGCCNPQTKGKPGCC